MRFRWDWNAIASALSVMPSSRILRRRFESLTQREREVVAMVVSGLPNRSIAVQIGITENTVKVHRSHAMEKMEAESLAALVKMAQHLEIPAHKIEQTKE